MDIERDQKDDKVSLTQNGVFEEGISEIRHQQQQKIYKYTIGTSFQVKNYCLLLLLKSVST